MTGERSMRVEVELLCHNADTCKGEDSQGEAMRLTTDVEGSDGLYRCPHCGTEVTVRITVKN
jgi:hypothetical protein